MLSLFLLALAASSTLGADVILSQPPTNGTIKWTPRIINGVDANEGQFPYIVSLNYVGDGHACGASILTPNWVLTAAHCCLTGNALNVYAGSIYLSRGGQTYDIVKYIIHGSYDPNNHWRNDICLIQTGQAIQYNNNAQPVKLPARDLNVPSGAGLTIPGWGILQNGGGGPDRLQVLNDDEALSNGDCGAATGVDVYDGQICARGNNGRGVCSGDSGGPLTFNGVQVGITSFVFLPCGSGYPDFYTRVSYYVDWIQQVLGSDAQYLQIEGQ